MGCTLEFFSSSHGRWIEVQILSRDDSGGVEVSAKPGAWIPAKDCKRKLRARIHNGDPSIGSTIAPFETYLEAQAGKLPNMSISRQDSAPLAAGAAINGGGAGGSVVTSAFQQVTTTTPPRTTTTPVITTTTASSIPAGGASVVSNAYVQETFNDIDSTGGYSRIMPQAPLQKSPQEFRPSDKFCPESKQQPLRPCYSCPHCGAGEISTFELAVQHCAGNLPEEFDPVEVPAAGSPFKLGAPVSFTPRPVSVDVPRDAAPTTGPTIEMLPTDSQPGVRVHRSRVVFVAAPGEDPEEHRSQDEVDGIWGVPTATLRKDVNQCSTTSDCTTDSTRSSEGQLKVPLVGEAIAYNIRGEPIITRMVSSDTGVGITTVLNEDGTRATFGKNTLQSLTSSAESDACTWISGLTTLEVRGLVHELGQVLLSTSAVYQFHLERLKQLSEKSHYAYFGLEEDATDKEIDMAYRKLAKQMHPDKNGGTPEAKERFQQMKEKYEALKEHRAEHGPGQPKKEKERNQEDGGNSEKDDSDKADGDKEDGDREGDQEEPKRKEAYDEDEDDTREDDKNRSSISYDPTDQKSLSDTAVEMLQRLKAIEGTMVTVVDQLRKHGQVVSPCV
jgi:hypothetical protein